MYLSSSWCFTGFSQSSFVTFSPFRVLEDVNVHSLYNGIYYQVIIAIKGVRSYIKIVLYMKSGLPPSR